MKVRCGVAAAMVAAAVSASASASTVTVIGSGSLFTNPGTSNQGQLLSGNWVYNNVRNSGQVGVTSAYPRSGNGSVEFRSPTNNGKADIEFLGQPLNVGGNFVPTASLGLLSNLNLSGLGYDWYRDSSSTNPNVQHPSYRILVDRDGNLFTTGDRGYLIFERAYNVGGPVPTDTWVTETITGASNMWSTGGLPDPGAVFNRNLSQWQALMPNARVLGFSLGVGSGWDGVFRGAVDNVRFGFGTSSTTYNFELLRGPEEIPTPAAFMAGSVLMGMLATRRRK
ncbi:MAG: hypothetical protein ACK4PI_01040 [Tepidisphaerales bacterium]